MSFAKSSNQNIHVGWLYLYLHERFLNLCPYDGRKNYFNTAD